MFIWLFKRLQRVTNRNLIVLKRNKWHIIDNIKYSWIPRNVHYLFTIKYLYVCIYRFTYLWYSISVMDFCSYVRYCWVGWRDCRFRVRKPVGIPTQDSRRGGWCSLKKVPVLWAGRSPGSSLFLKGKSETKLLLYMTLYDHVPNWICVSKISSFGTSILVYLFYKFADVSMMIIVIFRADCSNEVERSKIWWEYRTYISVVVIGKVFPDTKDVRQCRHVWKISRTIEYLWFFYNKKLLVFHRNLIWFSHVFIKHPSH